MRTSTLLVVLVVLLAFGPGSAAADVRGEPDLRAYATENVLQPGEETTIDVVLLNEGTLITRSVRNPELNDLVTTARGTTVTLEPGDAPLTVETGTQPVGSVPEGTGPPATFRVVVDEDAEPGTYELPVSVRYEYTWFVEEPAGGEAGGDRTQYERERTDELSVTVRIEEDARFEVVGVESDVAVGGRGTVDVSLRNVGTDAARDASVTLRSPNPELTLGGGAAAESYVGGWEPGETRNLTVGAAVDPDAERRSYALYAVVAYEDRDGLARNSSPLSFGVTPLVEASFAADGVESDLRVGEQGTLAGTVRNTGGSVARNAVVVFETDGETANPVEREVAVGDLAPGESANFSFDVDVSEAAEGGPRQFSLVVRYRDADGDVRRSDPVDVRAEVQPERDVFAVEPADASFRAGSDGRLDLVVTNRGDEPVTDVSAKLFADDPVSATDDEAFVRRLGPGERANVSFGVAVAGGAIAKEYPVTVDFQYDDADGDTLVTGAYRVPVRVVEAERGGGPGPDGDGPLAGRTALFAVAGVLAVAVLAVVGWTRFRR